MSGKAKISIVIAIMIIVIISLNIVKANSNRQYIDYVVGEGDTIWSIAIDNNIYKDVREMVYEIRKINNEEDCIIHVGQVLKIPITTDN